MIGYIYRITIVKENSSLNMCNYIGLHTSDSLEDKYFGSGKIVRDFRKKYGTKYFHKEILDYSDNYDELCELEIYYISMEKYNTKNLNIVNGGTVGNKMARSAHLGRKLSKETIEKIKESKKRNPRIYTKEEKQLISERMTGENNHMYGINVKDIMTEEDYKNMLLKRSKSMEGKMTSEKNPMFNHDISTKDIIKLYDEGKTITEISDILNCSYGLVYNRLKKSNKSTKRKVVNKTKVIELHNQGYSNKDIAEKMNCTPDNIYHIIKVNKKMKK